MQLPKLGLRSKILIGIVLLVFLPVILIGAISYLTFSDMIEKKTSSYDWLSLQDTDSKLKYALNEINTVTDLAITQSVIQDLLKRPHSMISSEKAQEINTYIMTHPQITSFSLYRQEGRVYQTNDPPQGVTELDLPSMPWYNKMKELDGKPLWIGPGESGIASSSDPMLLQVRMVKDYYSLETIGVLVVTVKLDILEQVFWEASKPDDGNLLLINEEGTIVYSKKGDQLGRKAPFSVLDQESQWTEKDYKIETYDGHPSLITYLPSFNKGWFLVSVTSLDQLYAESRIIRNIVLATVMFLLLTTFLFEKYFVSRLIKTIIRTVKGLKDIEEGKFKEIRLLNASNDETGMLVEGFNQMSRQIRELIHQVEAEQQRKKEAEMAALVAQINPHFIYNSLESINSLAVLQGNREISRMVISLGKLLRISISGNQELIPLFKEVEHVEHYMNIQKMRFEDKFDYSISLPPHLKLFLTQKLIIQPFVENALYHAIERMEAKGRIRVSVFEEDDKICIEITDNGPGFNLKELEIDPAIERKNKGNGVGLKNVHERLRIRFGAPYGIIICSEQGFGTIVRIRIPKLLSDDKISLPGGKGVAP